MLPVKGIWCNELELYICGTKIKLTVGEMRVFTILLSNPERIYSREALHQARVHDAYFKPDVNLRTIDILVKQTRKKIKNATGYCKVISSEYAMGYHLNRFWFENEIKKRKAGQ
jgi:DNA-binding response OmpR family regulator